MKVNIKKFEVIKEMVKTLNSDEILNKILEDNTVPK